MADRLTDARLSELLSTLKTWDSLQAQVRAKIGREDSLSAMPASDLLSLATELLERRHPTLRIHTEPHDTTLDGLIAKARERIAASMAEGHSERAESWGRLLVTLLRCDDKPTRNAEPPRVSRPGLKQETLSDEEPIRFQVEGPILPATRAREGVLEPLARPGHFQADGPIQEGGMVALVGPGRVRQVRPAEDAGADAVPAAPIGPGAPRIRVGPAANLPPMDDAALAACIMERIRDVMDSIPSLDVTASRAKGEVLGLAGQMHALVAARAPSLPASPGAEAPCSPIGNEMLANATRDNISARLKRLGQGGATFEKDKAEILRLVDELHALAVDGVPSARVAALQDVFHAAHRASFFRTPGWDAEKKMPPLLEALERAEKLPGAWAAIDGAKGERERKLEAVANAARDMHLGVEGAQQRLEDALNALDGARGGSGS